MKTIKEAKDLVGTQGFIRVEVTRWNPSGQVEIKPLCSNCDGKTAWVKPEDIISRACDEKIEVHETWNSLRKRPAENEKCIVLFKDGKISGALHICGAFKTDFTNFDEKLVAWRSINARAIAKARLHAEIDNLNIAEAEFPKLREELHKAVEEV